MNDSEAAAEVVERASPTNVVVIVSLSVCVVCLLGAVTFIQIKKLTPYRNYKPNEVHSSQPDGEVIPDVSLAEHTPPEDTQGGPHVTNLFKSA